MHIMSIELYFILSISFYEVSTSLSDKFYKIRSWMFQAFASDTMKIWQMRKQNRIIVTYKELPCFALQHVKEAFPNMYSSHSSQSVSNLHYLWRLHLHYLPLFLNFVQATCSFCYLLSLSECVITPQLMCYFAKRYYRPKLVEPFYLSISSLLLCVLCNKALNLI